MKSNKYLWSGKSEWINFLTPSFKLAAVLRKYYAIYYNQIEYINDCLKFHLHKTVFYKEKLRYQPL